MFAGLASPLVPRPAGRGVHRHLWSWLVVDKVGESMGRVGGPAWCCLLHVCEVVKVAWFVDHVLYDGARVRVSVKAVGAAVQAVVNLVCVGGSVAHGHLAKEAVVVKRLGTIAVPSVPVENYVAPAVCRGVRAYCDEFAYGAHCDLITVHASDGHVKVPAGIFVEGSGLE